MTQQEIHLLTEKQRAFFASGKTLPIPARRAALRRLAQAIRLHETEIGNALANDLGKSATESYMAEIGMVLEDLRYIEKHLAGWAKPRKAPTPLAQFPAKSYRVAEPYGTVLVMSPWNYPFLLTLGPVIGAIAAGNTVVVKPSAYSPSTSGLLFQLFHGIFPPEWVTVVTGGRAENNALLEERFDYIFFTGSVSVGRYVMEKAARHLTPVTLELGGKSPCIVDETADLALAAKRIVFGKYLNVGQTCVAPDYLLVQEKVKDRLLGCIKRAITECYGPDPLKNPQYGRIVNEKHFDRLCALLPKEGDGARIVHGGGQDRVHLRMEPTVLDGVSPDDPVMGEEIFGPILPILTFSDREEAIRFVNGREKPLAFYLFTRSKQAKTEFFARCSFGGGCVNDTIIHLATSHMPFGGVGASGMGGYHGKASLETFTHWRSVVEKSTKVDLPMRYAPYEDWKDRAIHLFLR